MQISSVSLWLTFVICERSELFMVKNVYLGFFDKFNLLQYSHGCTYWWIYFFSAHCKYVPCNTLTHSTNEDLLNIKRKGDPKSRTLSRTSDTTETQNPCVIKVILLACFTYIVLLIFFNLLNLFWHTDKNFCFYAEVNFWDSVRNDSSIEWD